LARAEALYVFMLREWAKQEQLDKIEAALTPPPSWRDPSTGLPAGWSSEDDEGWGEGWD
jgi:hypothetical protein